jgi:hypothetical protein
LRQQHRQEVPANLAHTVAEVRTAHFSFERRSSVSVYRERASLRFTGNRQESGGTAAAVDSEGVRTSTDFPDFRFQFVDAGRKGPHPLRQAGQGVDDQGV